MCFFLLMQLWVTAQTTATNPEIQEHFLIKDTTAITNQIKKVTAIAKVQPDSGLMLASQALQSSEALGYKEGMAEALLQLGLIYQNKNEFLHSIPFLQAALPYCANNMVGFQKKTSIFYFIGDAYWYASKPDSAAYYYYNALDQINASHITDPTILLETYSKLILMWVNLNDNNTPPAGTIDKYTGSAIIYFNKTVLQQGQNDAFRLRVLLNQGHIKRMEKKFDSARFYYQQYLHLALKDSSTPISATGWVVATVLNISESYLEETKPDSAIKYAAEAIRLIGDKKKEASMYYVIANYFTGKALCQQQKFAEAIAVILPALAIASKNNNYYAAYIAHNTLSVSYGATGRYKNAWEHQKIYTAITDSLQKNGSIQAVGQMEMRYRMAENRKELAEKELSITKKDGSIKSQRYLIAVISSASLLVLLTGFLLYRQKTSRQKIKLLEVEQQMELSHLNAMMEGEEKERSRLARELHDGIGGLLGSIRLQLGSALKTYKTEDRSEDFASILKLLEGAYADLRKTAHNLMPETLQQEGLEKATRLFCRGINKGGRTEVVFEAVGNIPAFSPNIELTLYRIMQELVHNIIKHAQASRALVQLEFIDNQLALTVEDDGVGFETDPIVHHDGMGLETIRNRVKSLGGTMDISGGLGEGTSVYIELEIKK